MRYPIPHRSESSRLRVLLMHFLARLEDDSFSEGENKQDRYVSHIYCPLPDSLSLQRCGGNFGAVRKVRRTFIPSSR